LVDQEAVVAEQFEGQGVSQVEELPGQVGQLV
jgi:hypothetical protein